MEKLAPLYLMSGCEVMRTCYVSALLALQGNELRTVPYSLNLVSGMQGLHKRSCPSLFHSVGSLV
jgi:hypothetical protein